jgi:hypothetical protein
MSIFDKIKMYSILEERGSDDIRNILKFLREIGSNNIKNLHYKNEKTQEELIIKEGGQEIIYREPAVIE